MSLRLLQVTLLVPIRLALKLVLTLATNRNSMHYTIVTEGGAHLIDANIIYANSALLFMWGSAGNASDLANAGSNQMSKIIKVNASAPYYYACLMLGKQERALAWSMRTICNSYCTVPDDWVEKPYFKDVIDAQGSFAVDFLANASISLTNFNALGIWCWAPNSHSWQQGYMGGAFAQVYKQTGNADILSFLNFLKGGYINRLSDDPSGPLGQINYRYNIRYGNTSGDWVAPADLTFQIGMQVGDSENIGMNGGNGGPNGHTWPTATPSQSFTVIIYYASANGGLWKWQPGDRVLWPSGDGSVAPGGFNQDQYYYVVNSTVSPATDVWAGADGAYAGSGQIKLSASHGGSPIACTSTPVAGGTGGELYYQAASGVLPTVAEWKATPQSGGTGNYIDVRVAAATYMKAVGVTGLDNYIATMSKYQAPAANFYNQQNGQAGWKMQASF